MSAPAIVHPKLAQASFERAIRPLLAAPEVFRRAGITLMSYTYPYLDVALDWHREQITLCLRVDGTDYRYRPINGWWIEPDGTELTKGKKRIPEGMGFQTAGVDGLSRAWFCFLGWRWYHDHQSHQQTSWASLRRNPRYSVLSLIQQLLQDLNGDGVIRV